MLCSGRGVLVGRLFAKDKEGLVGKFKNDERRGAMQIKKGVDEREAEMASFIPRES